MWDYYSLVPNQKHQIRQMDQIRITGFFGFCATQKISNLIEFGIFSNKILETSMLRILKIKKDGSVRVKFIIEMQNSQNIAKIVATFTWNWHKWIIKWSWTSKIGHFGLPVLVLRHLVGSVLNLDNYFEDLKKPLVGHYLMLYWTGNLFFAVHQES